MLKDCLQLLVVGIDQDIIILTDFREGNKFASRLTGFIDEVDGLLDTALQVEPLHIVRK
jgi:hypothetical protein